MSKFHITGDISTGSIEVLDASDPGNIRLALKADPATPWVGWFHYRVSGVQGVPLRMVFTNALRSGDERLAGREDYDDEWTRTGAVASYDLETWFRVPYQKQGDGSVVIEHTPEFGTCTYAKWAPYTPEQELRYFAGLQTRADYSVETLGLSPQGRAIDMLTFGEPGEGKRNCWIIARQHPSETMSGYLLEGFLDRLSDPEDAVARALLSKSVIRIVPNMNPDGVALGHSRGNGLGVNLNREWVTPSAENSPEVLCVRDRMEAEGVDFCLDCHGDEELRCVFLGGPLEIPSRSAELTAKFKDFERAWSAVTPEYEMGHPYPGGSPAEADLSMAWNWIGERFNCLSVLLEQPFKDTSWFQDEEQGWSPPRAYRLGDALVAALQTTVDKLR